MKTKTKLYYILIIGLFYLLGFVYATKYDFYNFAYIPQTAFLNFNGQVNGINYQVSIDDTKYVLYTGNNNTVYQCFKLFGTGYTDTMGEVYFSYEGKDSYICSDGKWRGLAKIGAGGRIYLEDMNLADGENWKLYLNKDEDISDNYFYNSRDGLGNLSGEALTFGLGFWQWNYVKTQFDIRAKMFDYISKYKSDLFIQSGKIANGIDKSSFELKIRDENGVLINGLWTDINIYTGNSKFWYIDTIDLVSGLYFDNFKTSIKNLNLKNGLYTTGVASIMGLSGSFEVLLKYKNKSIILNSDTNFVLPISASLSINDNNNDSKVLMGYDEKGNIDLSKDIGISNLSVIGKLEYIGTGKYIANKGVLRTGGSIDINIVPYDIDSFVDNELGIRYNIGGLYDLQIGVNKFHNIPFKGLNSTTANIYPDKEISLINMNNVCTDVLGNGNQICNIIIKLINKKGYNIPNLSFDLNIDDINKYSSNKKNTFDIDETTVLYDTGLFLSGIKYSTDNFGNSNIRLISYKPVISGNVLLQLENIKGINTDIYNRDQLFVSGNISNIDFKKPIELAFTGEVLNYGLKNGVDNNLGLVFRKVNLLDQIQNPSYGVSGRFLGCLNCTFQTGASFFDNNFSNKNIIINFSGSTDPDYLVYDNGIIDYDIVGSFGTKSIHLLSDLYINNKPLKDSSGLYLLGTINKGYNLFEVNKYNSSLNIFGSEDEIIVTLNKVKNQVSKELRGKKAELIFGTKSILSIENQGIKSFKCLSGANIVIGDTTDMYVVGKNKLVFYNCPISIKSNIFKTNNESKLTIINISDINNIDYSSSNGWKLQSNIYIYPNVKDIFSSLITNGSIFFLTNYMQPMFNNVFVNDRVTISNLKKQIFIKGKIVSRNILGGAFLVDNSIILPGGNKFTSTNNVFNQSIIIPQEIGKSYDINFWRVNFVDKVTDIYSTGDVSSTIQKQYNCSGKGYSQKICIIPVVVEDD